MTSWVEGTHTQRDIERHRVTLRDSETQRDVVRRRHRETERETEREAYKSILCEPAKGHSSSTARHRETQRDKETQRNAVRQRDTKRDTERDTQRGIQDNLVRACGGPFLESYQQRGVT